MRHATVIVMVADVPFIIVIRNKVKIARTATFWLADLSFHESAKERKTRYKRKRDYYTPENTRVLSEDHYGEKDCYKSNNSVEERTYQFDPLSLTKTS